MRRTLSTISCVVVLLSAACASVKDMTPDQITATGAAASTLIEEIGSLIRPLPPERNDRVPVDMNHSKVVFTNDTDRALTITLEGPRSYEVNVGYRGDVSMQVVSGRYQARASAPAIQTRLLDYTFEGGKSYEYRFYKPGHEPR